MTWELRQGIYINIRNCYKFIVYITEYTTKQLGKVSTDILILGHFDSCDHQTLH